MTSTQLAERIIGAKRRGDSYVGRCPAHEDETPSLSFKDGHKRVVLKCFAGCTQDEILAALDLTYKNILFERAARPASNRAQPRLTLRELGDAKGLPGAYLKDQGVAETSAGVTFAFRQADGAPARTHLRTALEGHGRFRWRGQGPIVPYGLDRLPEARKTGTLVVPEGETDCLSAWFHGIPALGIPGCEMAHVLQAEYLEAIHHLFVIREPGKGGQAFVNGMAKRLRDLGWPGEAHVVVMPDGLKDLNELHQDDPERFRDRLQRAMGTAMPLSAAVTERPEPRNHLGPPAAVGTPPRTDLGNSERFVEDFGRDIRYVPTWGWMVWDGRRWQRDEGDSRVMVLATKTVRKMYAEAAAVEDKEERDKLVKHARASEARARLEAIVVLAQHQVVAEPSAFDRDPWLLNVLNGTMNLRSAVLQPHRREDLITKLAPVPYDPEATAPEFFKFLREIMDQRQGLVDFLRRAVGYTLTGRTDEQVFFLLHGVGANGKTTFLKVLGDLLGDYARQATSDTFMVKRDGGIPNDVARLKGARLVAASEVEDGRRLAEVLVKQMTGGDVATARFLRREFFEFVPEFKVFLAANHKPGIRGTDHAVWRRIRLVPFGVVFTNPDRALPDRLRAELPGILAWAVEGCRDWQEVGLGCPDEIRVATEGYRDEEDVLAQFIEDSCVAVPAVRVQSSALYEAYLEWSKRTGEHQLSQKTLAGRLREKGFLDKKTGGIKYWNGLGLATTRDGEAGKERDRLAGSSEEMHSRGENPQERSPRLPPSPR